MSTEHTEWWTEDGQRHAVIEYDERGVAEVSREALHWLLERAGFRRVDEPKETEYSGNGRERLRRVALQAEDVDA